MKKSHAIITTTLFLALSAGTLNAENLVKDPSELLGTWVLQYTSPQLDAGEQRRSNQTWEFLGGGKLITKASDKRVAGGSFEIQTTYEVKDGKIVTVTPGQSWPTRYEVVKKENGTMVLKGGMEGYYFFQRQ